MSEASKASPELPPESSKPLLKEAQAWLPKLSQPIEDLRKKIKGTQENINDEKRKSLSIRKNRRGTNSQPRELPSQVTKDRIEVMETLIKVYKEELDELQNFTKLLAKFVIVNSDEVRIFKEFKKLLDCKQILQCTSKCKFIVI